MATVVPVENDKSAEAGAAIEEPELPEPPEEALPPLEDLVKRISPGVLTTMDELFRTKWTGVRRLPPESLKNG